MHVHVLHMCAPLLANLFLFYYDYKYMKNLIKNNIILAKKFNNTMRYMYRLKHGFECHTGYNGTVAETTMPYGHMALLAVPYGV